jgi:WD40 repeat protein
VTSLAWSSDGHLLAAGCRDATITVWDLRTGLETMTLSGHTAPIFSLAFVDERGRTLASSAEDNLVTFWDVSSGQALISATLHHRNTPLVLGPGPNGSDRGGLGRG